MGGTTAPAPYARGFDHSPLVKSGNLIGALSAATDIWLSGSGALQLAAS